MRNPYESTYDDFMELWLQFGHVFLFSSVYPLAGFFALLNNLFELKIDSYKMCRLTRKPTPRAVRDIGAWYMAFSITSVLSVMTNCALMAMDKDIQVSIYFYPLKVHISCSNCWYSYIYSSLSSVPDLSFPGLFPEHNYPRLDPSVRCH